MPSLRVRYTFFLSNIPIYLVLKGPRDPIIFERAVGQMQATVRLISDGGPSHTTYGARWDEPPGGAAWRYVFNKLQIELVDPNTEVSKYIWTREDLRFYIQHHYKIPLALANRVLGFFRYQMNTPGVRSVSILDLMNEQFTLVEWFDTDGRQIETPYANGFGPHQDSSFIGRLHDGRVGRKTFESSYVDNLRQFLSGDLEVTVSLSEELFDQARTAAFRDNERRAVLEAAIAIEVYVKTMFFKRDPVSGAAIDYIQDKGRESIKVTDLLHGAAKYAFGQSFKEFDGKAFADIDALFRCRNKVAHSGEARYRDDNGEWHAAVLEAWWPSIDKMVSWLSEQVARATANTK